MRAGTLSRRTAIQSVAIAVAAALLPSAAPAVSVDRMPGKVLVRYRTPEGRYRCINALAQEVYGYPKGSAAPRWYTARFSGTSVSADTEERLSPSGDFRYEALTGSGSIEVRPRNTPAARYAVDRLVAACEGVQ